MPHIPWWVWLALLGVALFMLARASRSAFRASVAEELLDFVRERRLAVEVVSVSEDEIVFRSTAPRPEAGPPAEPAEARMRLANVYADAAAVPSRDRTARRAVYRRFVDGLAQALDPQPLRLDTHGDRVLPRLVTGAFLVEVAGVLKKTLPRRDLSGTGLAVVYVIDGETSVTYITEPHRLELGLEPDALHARALANLRRRSPADLARAALAGGAVSLVKTLDTYDAARLLLLPEQLREGEELAAVIPDRDTLAVARVPSNGDWSGLQRLARATAGPPLLDRPLRVKKTGFELV